MGLLVDGVWQQDGQRTKDGHFIRPTPRYRNWVTPDGSPGPSGEGGFAAESGRYHLYVSLACPWAHRTIIFRKLKALENVISMSVVSPDMLQDGWTFNKDEGSTGDAVNGKSKLSRNLSAGRSEIFRPRQRAGAVGQEAQDNRQQRVAGNHPHVELGVRRLHQCAHRLLSEGIARRDRPAQRADLSEHQQRRLSRRLCHLAGGLRAGFPQLFDALDEIEQILSTKRYLTGSTITEADWRLFPTLIRFDAVYYSHFKCNWRHIYEYPNLSNYVRDLYQQPGVAETVSLAQIKRHYYHSQKQVNPTGIVPVGPQLDFSAPHDRARLG